MATLLTENAKPTAPAKLLAKAATRAADRLGIRQRELGRSLV